jgi:hypothetical protein
MPYVSALTHLQSFESVSVHTGWPIHGLGVYYIRERCRDVAVSPSVEVRSLGVQSCMNYNRHFTKISGFCDALSGDVVRMIVYTIGSHTIHCGNSIFCLAKCRIVVDAAK